MGLHHMLGAIPIRSSEFQDIARGARRGRCNCAESGRQGGLAMDGPSGRHDCLPCLLAIARGWLCVGCVQQQWKAVKEFDAADDSCKQKHLRQIRIYRFHARHLNRGSLAYSGHLTFEYAVVRAHAPHCHGRESCHQTATDLDPHVCGREFHQDQDDRSWCACFQVPD